MKIGIIIQARTGSQRLPKKILKPFYGSDNILDIQIKNLKQLSLPIIIATTEKREDLEIIDIAKKHHLAYFAGSEHDVLSRFINAAKENKLTHIIRICSDNPFLMIDFVKEIIEKSNINDDYTSHFINDEPTITTHWGIFCEFVSLNALLKIQGLTTDPFYKEHVTNYIYSHPESFSIKKIMVNDTLTNTKNIRLTVDTEDDFLEMKKLYQNYFNNFDRLNIDNLVKIIDSNVLKNMRKSIEKNSKK